MLRACGHHSACTYCCMLACCLADSAAPAGSVNVVFCHTRCSNTALAAAKGSAWTASTCSKTGTRLVLLTDGHGAPLPQGLPPAVMPLPAAAVNGSLDGGTEPATAKVSDDEGDIFGDAGTDYVCELPQVRLYSLRLQCPLIIACGTCRCLSAQAAVHTCSCLQHSFSLLHAACPDCLVPCHVCATLPACCSCCRVPSLAEAQQRQRCPVQQA